MTSLPQLPNSWDCVLRYAGQIEPEIVIYPEEDPDARS